MLIGVGQGGPFGRDRHPQMLQLSLATGQAAANLAQRMRPSQLAKQHRHELAPTGETPRVPFRLVLLDRLFEISAQKQLQHLRENAAYFMHRSSLLRLNWFLSGTQPSVSGGSTSQRSDTLRLRPPVSPLIWTAVIFTPLFIFITPFGRYAVSASSKSFAMSVSSVRKRLLLERLDRFLRKYRYQTNPNEFLLATDQ
jgi:hypothetical protein